MIAYSPLEPVIPVQARREMVPEPEPTIGPEETEMNYVIMAFIIGVIILAISDSMRGL